MTPVMGFAGETGASRGPDLVGRPVGSAAGVALMGQARGMYTLFGHLRWTPVIAVGYVASILTHMWINATQF